MKVEEVTQELGVSKSYAYKIVQKLNAELAEKGYMVISGRVNKQYFMERTCYGAVQKAEVQSRFGSYRSYERVKAAPKARIDKRTAERMTTRTRR